MEVRAENLLVPLRQLFGNIANVLTIPIRLEGRNDLLHVVIVGGAIVAYFYGGYIVAICAATVTAVKGASIVTMCKSVATFAMTTIAKWYTAVSPYFPAHPAATAAWSWVCTNVSKICARANAAAIRYVEATKMYRYLMRFCTMGTAAGVTVGLAAGYTLQEVIREWRRNNRERLDRELIEDMARRRAFEERRQQYMQAQEVRNAELNNVEELPLAEAQLLQNQELEIIPAFTIEIKIYRCPLSHATCREPVRIETDSVRYYERENLAQIIEMLHHNRMPIVDPISGLPIPFRRGADLVIDEQAQEFCNAFHALANLPPPVAQIIDENDVNEVDDAAAAIQNPH